MSEIFFDNWMSVVRTLVNGSLAYLSLIFFLRISGKRTLSKMNMFDFIVTVAFGSTLATIILSKDVPLLQGVIGLGLLVSLQYVITFTGIRVKCFDRLIKATPTLLFFDSQYCSDTLKQERVTKEEIEKSFRRNGHISARNIAAIILETDGSFSVIDKSEGITLEEIRRHGIAINENFFEFENGYLLTKENL